jgi:phosphatidylglycerophosphatase A
LERDRDVAQRRQPLVRFVATGGGLGFSPVAPGTAGSAGCAILVWFLAPEITVAGTPVAILAAVLSAAAFAAMSVWFADRAEVIYGHDSPRIVIDEFAGFIISILLLPKTALVFVAAFLLFRVMDIVKPFPARRAEALPGGLGIVADDLVAGVYANLLLRLMLLTHG